MNKTTKKTIEMKEVLGFSRYSVNVEEGTIYDKEREIYLKNTPNQTGYVYVNMVNDIGKPERLAAHRIVYMAHTGESIPRGFHVHHDNRDRTNNSISNLRLITHSENMKLRGGYKKFKFMTNGEIENIYNDFANLKMQIGNRYSKFNILAEKYGVSIRTVQNRFKEFKDFNESEMLA